MKASQCQHNSTKESSHFPSLHKINIEHITIHLYNSDPLCYTLTPPRHTSLQKKKTQENTQTTSCVKGDKSHLNMHRNPTFTSQSACKLEWNMPIPNHPSDLLFLKLHPLGSFIGNESNFFLNSIAFCSQVLTVREFLLVAKATEEANLDTSTASLLTTALEAATSSKRFHIDSRFC